MVYNMKNNLKYLPIGILTLTTAVSGAVLSGTGVSAADTASAGISVTVGAACTFSAGGSASATTTINAQAGGGVVNTESLTRPNFSISCNDPDGFVIQAAGQNGDTNLRGNGAISAAYIPTGTTTSGTSSWAFKVTNATATAGTVNYAAYQNYSSVPATATTIASYSGSASAVVSGTMRTDYQIYTTSSQASGTYTGAVEYTIVP